MGDVRLPYANAQKAGLLPDLGSIRTNFEHAALALRNNPIDHDPVRHEPYIQKNPWFPIHGDLSAASNLCHVFVWKNPSATDPHTPDRRLLNSDLNVAQRALLGAARLGEICPPWEDLCDIFGTTLCYGEISMVLWAAHEIDLGRTREYLDAYARMYLLDPDAMRAEFVANPDRMHQGEEMLIFTRSEFEDARIRKNFEVAKYSYKASESYRWWSTGEAQIDFNRRVLEYTERHLNELIVLDGAVAT